MPSQTEFINDLAREIRYNAKLADHCQKKFGKGVTVFVNVDERVCPPSTYCPFVVIRGGGRALSETGNMRNREIRVSGAIKDERKQETNDDVVTFPGFETVDEFGTALEEVLFKYVHPSGFYSTLPTQGAPEDQPDFPIFKCFLGLSISFDAEL